MGSGATWKLRETWIGEMAMTGAQPDIMCLPSLELFLLGCMCVPSYSWFWARDLENVGEAAHPSLLIEWSITPAWLVGKYKGTTQGLAVTMNVFWTVTFVYFSFRNAR